MHTDKCLIKYVYLQAEKTQRAPLLEYSNIQIGVPARGYLRARKHIRNEVFCIDRCVLWPEHPLFYISECFHPTLHFKMSEIIFASLYHLCQFIISFLNLQLAVRAGIINFCNSQFQCQYHHHPERSSSIRLRHSQFCASAQCSRCHLTTGTLCSVLNLQHAVREASVHVHVKLLIDSHSRH